MKLFIKGLLLISIITTGMVEVSSMFAASQPARNIALKQVQVKTIQEALMHVRKSIKGFPYLKNAEIVQAYEKEDNNVLVKCAKVLYDTARIQILEALSEIDNRMAYWQYQKDHPWNYFVSKNPMKWVTGQKQKEEIENNLETLKSHQGELYVLLGQLAERGTDFTQGYKDTFLADYTKGYAWIDELLDALVRIKTKALSGASSSPFIARAELLKAKLENVNRLKDDLLADISETAMPGYLARNWLKGSAMMMALGYGYRQGALEQLQNSFNVVKEGLYSVASPVKTTVQDIVYAGRGGGFSADTLTEARNTTLELAKKFVRDNSAAYDISEDRKKAIIDGLDNDSYGEYQKFLDTIASRGNLSAEERSDWKLRQIYQGVKSGLIQASGLGDFAQGKVYYFELLMLSLQKQFSAVTKIVLFIPAALTGGFTYAGYQKLTETNYAPIRRALVDINSLFVDPSKPLHDEQYGKMLHLIYMLKKQAEKVLPQKNNIREDFIHDLERIELQEFNVAAKRAIVEDMFKKYDFLGLVQKK